MLLFSKSLIYYNLLHGVWCDYLNRDDGLSWCLDFVVNNSMTHLIHFFLSFISLDYLFRSSSFSCDLFPLTKQG